MKMDFSELMKLINDPTYREVNYMGVCLFKGEYFLCMEALDFDTDPLTVNPDNVKFVCDIDPSISVSPPVTIDHLFALFIDNPKSIEFDLITIDNVWWVGREGNPKIFVLKHFDNFSGKTTSVGLKTENGILA
jgi:hypothetical protein